MKYENLTTGDKKNINIKDNWLTEVILKENCEDIIRLTPEDSEEELLLTEKLIKDIDNRKIMYSTWSKTCKDILNKKRLYIPYFGYIELNNFTEVMEYFLIQICVKPETEKYKIKF